MIATTSPRGSASKLSCRREFAHYDESLCDAIDLLAQPSSGHSSALTPLTSPHLEGSMTGGSAPPGKKRNFALQLA